MNVINRTIMVRIKYNPTDFKTRDMSYLKSSNIEKKEFFETKETIDKALPVVRKFFGVDRLNIVYDLCSGHSFSCYYTVSRNLTKYAISIDRRNPKNSYTLSSFYPQFIPRVSYRESDIFLNDYVIEPYSVVLGIHPCADLAFRVAEIAIKSRVPVIIVPCCKGGKVKSWIDSLNNLTDYQRYSMKIAELIAINNYEIKIKKINEIYTPKNIIIIGIPR